MSNRRVVVVGAGIIGLSVAMRLAMEGFEVRVIDRNAPMTGCSYGNAGYLTESNIFPPLSRDVLKKLPWFLLDPKSPLVVRPSYIKAFAPWAWQAAKQLHLHRATVVQKDLASLAGRAIEDFSPLLEEANARDLITKQGSLIVFRKARSLRNRAQMVDTLQSHGISARNIDKKTLCELEPALTHDLAGAIHLPNTGHCLDPEALGLRYVDKLVEMGGIVVHDNVRNVASVSDGVCLEGDANSYHADEVVICAGYASRSLLKSYGLHIPIASERGYHYMLPKPGVQLHRPVVFGERYFVATPMHNGLRLAGTAEFSWPQAEPDMDRAKSLYKETLSYVPSLCDEDGRCWMGVRPSLPDAKPAIGRLKSHPNVLYAFGHGHSGLTYSATTAHYIHALLADHKKKCQYGDFSIERFNR